MTLPEPHIDPEDLPALRNEIEAMRARPEQFLALRGTALQLLDDLDTAYARLATLYDRIDAIVGAARDREVAA